MIEHDVWCFSDCDLHESCHDNYACRVHAPTTPGTAEYAARVEREFRCRFLDLQHSGDAPLPEDLRQAVNPLKRIQAVLGLTRTIPKEFGCAQLIDGHLVLVYRNDAKPCRVCVGPDAPHCIAPDKHKRYFHRVFFRIGTRLVPAGRLHQFFQGKGGVQS